MAASRRQHAVDFPSLLRNVALAAMDRLVDCLRSNGSLASARLACQGLRDAVDGSIQELCINISPEDEELSASGQLPVLERWPRCRVLTLTASPAASHANGPGSSVKPERRLRIAHLSCDVQGVDVLRSGPIISLASFLPSLRELKLHKVHLSCDPLQLSSMHGALANLKQLEFLSLPSCRALEGISALGSGGDSSLRRLEIWEAASNRSNAPAIQSSTLAGLSQLHGLQRLTLVSCSSACSGFDAAACVGLLTARLPPSFATLELKACQTANPCGTSITVDLRRGKMHSVHISTGQTLQDLVRLADGVLLPGLPPVGQWPALQPSLQSPPQLEHLTVPSLWVAANYAPNAAEIGVLTALRRRFRNVELGSLCLRECADPKFLDQQLMTAFLVTYILATPHALEVQVAMRITGGSVGQQVRYPTFSFSLGDLAACPGAPGLRSSREELAVGKAVTADVEAAGTVELQRPRPASHGDIDASAPITFSTTAQVVRLALECMAESASEAVADAAPPAEAVMSSGNCVEAALLQGPFVTSLCQTPTAVGPWLEMLEQHIAPCCAGNCAGLGPGLGPRAAHRLGGNSKRIRAYQLLPTAGALLLACDKPAAPALAAAAARAVESVRGSRPTFAQLPTGGALNVVPLGHTWTWGELGPPVSIAAPLQDVLLYSIGKAVQSVWRYRADPSQAHAVSTLMYLALEFAMLVREEKLVWELPQAVVL